MTNPGPRHRGSLRAGWVVAVCLALAVAVAGTARAAPPPPPARARPLVAPASPDVPVEDPLGRDFEKLALRYRPRGVPLHRRPWSRMEVARAVAEIRRERAVTDPTMRRLLERVEAQVAAELRYLQGGSGYWKPQGDPVREVRLEVQAAPRTPDADPWPDHGGDASGPFLALSDRLELGAGPGLAVVEPRVVVDPMAGGQAGLLEPVRLGGDLALDLRTAYVKLAGPGVEITAGTSDRAWGPGHASLILSNNAQPVPTVRARTDGALFLPGFLRYAGAFAVETSWSLLNGPRTDVEDPSMWALQLTWLPLPWIELSLERAAIYGGEGRPPATAKDAWELFWGTRPHTSDDVSLEEFDAEEIASLDARVDLPFAPSIPGVQFIQVYWQYAGEDVITRKFLGVDAPALAGVGNLGGVYLGVGPFTARFEGAILRDDRFRWYEQHRIYHQGFYHRGRVMGHPMRGDARSYRLDVGYDAGGAFSADAWYEDWERLGVLDEIDGTVYVLPVAERRRRAGLEARLRLARPGPFQVAVRGQIERISGAGFVPGEIRTHGAVAVEVRIPLSRWDLP